MPANRGRPGTTMSCYNVTMLQPCPVTMLHQCPVLMLQCYNHVVLQYYNVTNHIIEGRFNHSGSEVALKNQ